jgi:hypothetical protein
MGEDVKAFGLMGVCVENRFKIYEI